MWVGLQLTGTLGVLLKSHRPGLASRDLEEGLRLLEEADTRVQVRVLDGSLSQPISIQLVSISAFSLRSSRALYVTVLGKKRTAPSLLTSGLAD